MRGTRFFRISVFLASSTPQSCGLKVVGTLGLNFFCRKSSSMKSSSPWDFFTNMDLDPRRSCITLSSASLGIFLVLAAEWPSIHALMFSFFNSTTSTFLELELATTDKKSSKSKTTPPGLCLISCSTPWWKLSALIKVCPGSKNFKVTSSADIVSEFTNVSSEENRHQFLFGHYNYPPSI